jgi:hypothetical protein
VRVLVACEFSGIVRDAFRARGHDAWSCDLEPTEADPQYHLTGDVRQILDAGWDMMIAFPPCTYLAGSGNRWYAGTELRAQAVQFVRMLYEAPIPRVAIENPRGHLSVAFRRPDLVIHPWEYGHRETKATCLWLRNLPPLMTGEVWAPPYEARIWRMPATASRTRERSRSYPGIATAMAEQWG